MARLATPHPSISQVKRLETRLEQVTQAAQKLEDVAIKCRELFKNESDLDAEVKKKQKIAQKLYTELNRDNMAVFHEALDIVKQILAGFDSAMTENPAVGNGGDEQDAAMALMTISGKPCLHMQCNAIHKVVYQD